MRPTMFVVMVEMPQEINLRKLYFDLEHKGYSVKASAPGSLGQRVVNVHEWVIGSIQAKVLGASILVFPNGKIKVSGGSAGYDKNVSGKYDTWLETEKVLPVLRALFPGTVVERLPVKISLINGSHTLSEINMLNFFDICNLLEEIFNVSKPSMLVNPSKRGRICSVSVQTHKIKGSMRFDHSGKLQLFGFKSYNDMEMMLGMLETHLKNIHS